MAAERRARIPLYVGPGPTHALEGSDERSRAAFRAVVDRYERSGDYVFEVKEDGAWCLATVREGRIAEMSSRTGLAFESSEVAGILGRQVGGPGTCGRLVGELVADRVDDGPATIRGQRAGQRRLILFDVLDWNGVDLRDLAQTDRREALVMVHDAAVSAHDGDCWDFATRDVLRVVEQRTEGIADWFDEVIADGGEGIVAKKRDARCRAKNADGKIESWVRFKRKRTVDYVVLSHGKAEKGTPNLQLGLYFPRAAFDPLVGVPQLRFVLDVTLPPHWRKLGDLTGRVVEAAGWEVFPSGALRSAQIGHRPGPRSDKMPTDCTIDAALKA